MTARGPRTASAVAGWSLVFLGLLVAAVAAGALLGAGAVSPLAWLGREAGSVEATIFFRIRLPRVLLAGILGAGLAVSGVAFQALLRNPLADPYVLGVSGGASLGGVLALLFGLGGPARADGGLGVPVFAFAGALLALVVVERLATVGGQLTVTTMLLTGAVWNAFCAALIYFLQSVASLQELHAIVFYLMGSVPALGYPTLAALGLATLAGVVVLVGSARELNLFSLGEEGAGQLGVDVERVKRRVFLVGCLLTGLAVSVSGMIGFVGLVVPHLLRLLLGPDHRLLLPASCLGGAAFLVVADLLARTLIAPVELPVGVVTALVGGPFFLVLLRRRGGEIGGAA